MSNDPSTNVGTAIGDCFSGPVSIIAAGTTHDNSALIGALSCHVDVGNAPKSLTCAFAKGNEIGYAPQQAAPTQAPAVTLSNTLSV